MSSTTLASAMGYAMMQLAPCSRLNEVGQASGLLGDVQGARGKRRNLSRSWGPACSGNSSGVLVRKALLLPPAAMALTTGCCPPRLCKELCSVEEEILLQSHAVPYHAHSACT